MASCDYSTVLCQLDFHHMNVLREALSHVLCRAAYNVWIAHPGPQEKGFIRMTKEFYAGSKITATTCGKQMMHVFFPWL